MLDLKIAGRNRKQPLSQQEQTRFESLNTRLQAAYEETLTANPEAEGQSFCRVCARAMLLPSWEGYAECSDPNCSWLGKVFYLPRFFREKFERRGRGGTRQKYSQPITAMMRTTGRNKVTTYQTDPKRC